MSTDVSMGMSAHISTHRSHTHLPIRMSMHMTAHTGLADGAVLFWYSVRCSANGEMVRPANFFFTLRR